MRVLILTSVVSDQFAYAPGDKVTIADADATRLINGGFALRLIETATFKASVETAARTFGYTLMASPSAAIPTPSGGFYWDSAERLHVVHPSGGRAILDPLALLPGWSP